MPAVASADRRRVPREVLEEVLTIVEMLQAFLHAAAAFAPHPRLGPPPAPAAAAASLRSPQPAMESRFKIRRRIRGVVVPTWNALIDGLGGNRVSEARSDEVPSVLSDEICLVPGKPVVRVEVAPGNARRIFTGIDIVAECDVLEEVWRVLTDYDNLASVVPNLISNEVVSLDERGGARLKQIGAAKLAPGVVFRALCMVDVREYISGLPSEMEADHLTCDSEEECYIDDAAAAEDDTTPEYSAAVRKSGEALPLRMDIFPRPYVISSLPHRDVTMQGVADVGDFSHYQGVWRMQRLPGCAPPGQSAMRLTYSVELSPRLWVPVALLEGRIAEALGENLEAIRDYVCAIAPSSKTAA